MTDLERSTLERALAPLPPAESLQAESLQAESLQADRRSWSSDRAHARLRLLSGIVGLVGTALIVAILIMGEAAHG